MLRQAFRHLRGAGATAGQPGFRAYASEVSATNVAVIAAASAVGLILLWPTDALVVGGDAGTMARFARYRALTALACAAVAWLALRVRWSRRHPGSVLLGGTVLGAAVAAWSLRPDIGLDRGWMDVAYMLPLATCALIVELGRRIALTLALTVAWLAVYFALAPAELHREHLWVHMVVMGLAVLLSVALGEMLHRVVRRTHRAAAGVEAANQQLERSVADKRRELRALYERIVATRGQERARLSRDLHDATGQLLTGLRLGLDVARARARPGGELARRLPATGRILDALFANIQRVLRDLRPELLHDHGPTATPAGSRPVVSCDDAATGVRPLGALPPAGQSPADQPRTEQTLDPAAARAFEAHSLRVTLRGVHNGALLLGVLVVMCWPLDLLLEPALIPRMAVFRLVSAALAVSYWLGFRYLAPLRRRPRLAASGVVIAALVGCLCNADKAGLALPWIDHVYLIPFITLLGFSSLGRRVAVTFGAGLGFVMAYFALFPAQLASPNAGSFVVVMTIAALISVTIGHLIQHLSWRHVLLSAQLERANAALDDEVARQTRELRVLNQRALALREAERDRLATELGGEFARLIMALAAELADIESLAAAGPGEDALVRADIAHVRELARALASAAQRTVVDLGPEALDGRGLPAALHDLAGTLAPATTAVISCDLDDVDLPREAGAPDGSREAGAPDHASATKVTRALYRVAQEALTNAVRHARATRIELSLRRHGDAITLRVGDDGAGLDAPSTRRETGIGMLSMRERAGSIGAELAVDSTPGHGTAVTLTVRAPAVR